MEVLGDLRQSLYHLGAAAVASLQKGAPPGLDNILLNVSSWGDPSQGFVLYFPIIIAFSYHRGLAFLGTFIVSEWTNMVGKWLLHGERPYWWVEENAGEVELIQTRLTCETGPGTPSGHSQASAVVWFALVDTAISLLPSVQLPAWSLFMLMQLLMFLSRTFIAAHFPHQCILGLLTGLLIVRTLYKSPSWLQRSRAQLVMASLFLITSSLAVFSALLWAGFDPNWSIRLAQKHCKDPSWIYIDTTPFYAMVRFSGSALGLALSLPPFLPLLPPSTPRRLAILGVTLGLGQLSSALHRIIPRSDLNHFYLLEFLLNSFSVMTTVRAVQLLRGRKRVQEKVP